MIGDIEAKVIGGDISFSTYIFIKGKWLKVIEATEVKDDRILKLLA